MKITRIEICNFRGFPGPGTYTFDLEDGKNLLLYGDNGSGKSSLSRALAEFFNLSSSASPFSDFRNLFAEPDASATGVALTFGPTPTSRLVWSPTEDRPTTDQTFAETALRKAFLDYRSLLRTSFLPDGSEPNLFRLVVEQLLAEHEVPAGKLGDLWRQACETATRSGVSSRIRKAQAAVDRFNRALDGALRTPSGGGPASTPTLETKMTELLAGFVGHGLTFRFEFPGVVHVAKAGRLDRQDLWLRVAFHGQEIPRHDQFLNEARLSAIGLCIYLASRLISVPAPVPGASGWPKLLVLDDVLIGLDMSNRLPVLDLFRRHFADWQIILMTYDRHWFEVAKRELGDGWIKAELYEGEDDQGHPRPILIMPSLSDYERARAYFDKRDYPACANYLRKVCEAALVRFLPEYTRLRKEENGETRYIRTLGELRSAFIKYLQDNGGDTGPFAAFERIIATVLNTFSHADIATPIYRSDIETAFELADRLCALRNEVVAEAGTEVVVEKEDGSGQTWRYRVSLKQTLRALLVNGVSSFTKCEAHPIEFRKDGVVQSLANERDAHLQRLYDRYCHHIKVPKATQYDDFCLPDGKSLEQHRIELMA